jgi:hypothetical protein
MADSFFSKQVLCNDRKECINIKTNVAFGEFIYDDPSFLQWCGRSRVIDSGGNKLLRKDW